MPHSDSDFLVYLFIGGAFYFLPSIIGFSKKKKNKGAILTLNFLLGWTVIGWIVSLVWAMTND